MKTCLGLDKIPYCRAHYPEQKPTVVTDTLELERLKINSKLQSHVAYTADHMKVIGTSPLAANSYNSQGSPNKNQSNNGAISHSSFVQLQTTESNYDLQKSFHCKAVSINSPEDPSEVLMDLGDTLTNCIIVSEGWLHGLNERTGKAGLIPYSKSIITFIALFT
ncbi:hypothetical protein ROZALSC1DRAFT_31357 [Rozella allomycis CSF55]|uniref:SH3 domain-containing protein n=1 Tax=Rozella allomycis (strain CSF55) TaxID=988480 RepID=A0A4P9YCE8_ROZAC|nr:hypothetical protein ROZALSC1DRAFT_31357 [Rozella allomycis CSF55]